MAEIDLLESKFSIISRLSLLMAFQGASANQEMENIEVGNTFRSKRASVGCSEASASDANVSIIRLTHNIWTAFNGESYNNYVIDAFALRNQYDVIKLTLTIQAPVNATIMATTLTVSWNCKNFEIES